MKLRNIILSSTIILSSLAAGAQNNEEKTELTFIPHWYVQGQFGAQETLGETSFGRLLSPNAQIGVGYKFNPYIGVRLAIDAWQSKGAFEYNGNCNKYSWNFVAPTVDAVVDLTNLIGGYKERKISAGILAGIGANIGFGNNEAGDVKDLLLAGTPSVDGLPLYWDGTKVKFMGKFGAYADYNISDKWSVGLEVNANVLHDAYNSKRAHNADWFFNGLVGVKYNIGKTSRKRYVTVAPVSPVVKTVHDTVNVVKTVRDTVYINREVEKKEPTMRRDIFFNISNATVSKSEMTKVKDIAEFMKANPNVKVEVTGYADKGTGNDRINTRLSRQRANIVAEVLNTKYGIPTSRMIVKSMKSEDKEPYNTPKKNRVAICVIE